MCPLAALEADAPTAGLHSAHETLSTNLPRYMPGEEHELLIKIAIGTATGAASIGSPPGARGEIPTLP